MLSSFKIVAKKYIVIICCMLLTVQFTAPAFAQTSTGGGTPAGTNPPINPEAMNELLGALGNVISLSNANGEVNAGAIADAIQNMNYQQLSNLLSVLQDPNSGGITGIAGQIDIGALGNIAEGFGNNTISNALQNAFSNLEGKYNSGTLSPSEQQNVYRQMQALQSALQNYGTIKDLTGLAKNGVQGILENAGLSNLVDSMKDLFSGNITDPQDLANRLADIDWAKLSDAMDFLGIPGPEALAKFLPEGTDPAELGKIFDAYKNGGLQGLVDTLMQDLKDKIAAGIGDIPALQDALDKLEQWKGKLQNGVTGFLGGLINGLFKKRGNGGVANFKANCETLFKDTTSYGVHSLPADLIYECVQRGIDPPKALRKNAGTGETANAISNSVQQVGGCRSNGVCLNSSLERTTNFASGYLPQNNPNLTLPEISWKDVTRSNLPCGAIGSLSEMAIQAIWRNVKIQMPSMVQNLINSTLTGLLGGLFGKKVDCQDGTFWGTLNTIIGLLLPQLQAGGYVYDITNNTFLAPTGALLTLPNGASVQIDLSQGNASFTLPAGGSFVDQNGNTVTISSNGTVVFGSNGTVTANGQNYQVDPNSIINLNTNGVLAIPDGTQLPVPPDSTLIPMGPVTTPPDWAPQQGG